MRKSVISLDQLAVQCYQVQIVVYRRSLPKISRSLTLRSPVAFCRKGRSKCCLENIQIAVPSDLRSQVLRQCDKANDSQSLFPPRLVQLVRGGAVGRGSYLSN